MGLLDDLRRLFADAEVSLVGARDERVEAERALLDNDFFRARSAARRILDRAPRSPIGLALLADACEGAGLVAELEEALATLAKSAGASPEVWLRLGRVRLRVGAPSREVREALTRALAWDDAPEPEARNVARSARLALADLEIAEGSAVRAEGWLAPIDDTHADVSARRLACAVSRRARDDVARLLPSFAPDVSDGAGQRLVGEAESIVGNASNAARALARAAILGDDRAVDALRETVARSSGLDAAALRAVETVATSLHLERDPLWRAALAGARGDVRAAASALADALSSGVQLASPADAAAARAIAIAARDASLLARVGSSGDAAEAVDAALIEAARALQESLASQSVDEAQARAATRGLDALLRASSSGAQGEDAARAAWATELSRALVARLFPPLPIATRLRKPEKEAGADAASANAAPPASTALAPRDVRPASWDVVIDRLAAHARAFGDLDALRRLEHLAAERARPVRIAIVGEFNAGKSTFVNALLGMDVAPTGILPTTAVAHVLRYGPDPIARARLRFGGARTVPPERLKSLLSELDREQPGSVAEVEVEVPFPYLQRVEIVDTPGFNAPDPEHTKTAMATLVEGGGVDVAIWLFDVGQALKTSERRVIEAIVARGIPLQALLNKSDRFNAAEVEKVMTTFDEDARSIGLRSWRPPLAFSARKAVEARVSGDAAALESSGFSPVRALLEDELPAHGPTLKERALRRRAYDVALALSQRASREHEALLARRASHSDEQRTLLSYATHLDRAAALDVQRGVERATDRAGAQADRRADDTRRAVRDELRGAVDAFRKERDELLANDDPAMTTYLERRLAEVIESSTGRAMAAALRGAAGPEAPPRDAIPLEELAIDAGAIARGYAAGGTHVVDRAEAEGGLVRALLGTLVARLRSRAALGRHGGKEVDVGEARARELASVVEVLADE